MTKSNEINEPDFEESTEVEERADFLPSRLILANTAESEFSKGILTKLMGTGAKLIVGPRGCGKTHLMRYAALLCKQHQSNNPVGIYVSFTKYYRLEPLLRGRANALSLFHTWVLGKILLETAFESEHSSDFLLGLIEVDENELSELISRLEVGSVLSAKEEDLAARITLARILAAIEILTAEKKRNRAVILLDDAALSLTPEYLVEFFDIYRSLKTAKISPKASVYPGTTEYGPRFHVRHDAESVPAWLSVAHEDYSSVMQLVAKKRFARLNEIPEEISELFKYAAFGITRVYLTMLRDYLEVGEAKGSASQQQQRVNRIIQAQNQLVLDEYVSLQSKLPQFGTVIEAGSDLFRAIGEQLHDANQGLVKKNEKQLIIGIEREDSSSLIGRMVNLLTEVGLLFPLPSVQHGESRKYDRYIPHLAHLIEVRAFSGGSRGFSARSIVDFIVRKPTKHPVRRKLSTLLSNTQIDSIKLDLPPCQTCGEPRIQDSQKFCSNCGSVLTEESAYQRCMLIDISRVPGIPERQKNEINEKTDIRTIGDLLAMQEPAAELRKGRLIGPKRAHSFYNSVVVFVDEFLA